MNRVALQAMLRVHLYGLLRRLVDGSRPDEDTVLNLEAKENESFGQLVDRLGLGHVDIGDCFINGRLASESSPVKDGNRIGLFPFNMRLIDGGMELNHSPYRRTD